MELIKAKTPAKCEVGACKNKASHTLKLSKSGIKSSINLCLECMKKLYGVMLAEFVPKSIETAKPKRKEERVEQAIY